MYYRRDFCCAYIESREDFMSFFQELYDIDPDYIRPTHFRFPYIIEQEWMKVIYKKDRQNESAMQLNVWMTETGRFNLCKGRSQLGLEVDFPHNFCRQSLVIDSDLYGGVISKGVGLWQQTSNAHQNIAFTDGGTILIPSYTIADRSGEILRDFSIRFVFVEYKFTLYVQERVKSLFEEYEFNHYKGLFFTETGHYVYPRKPLKGRLQDATIVQLLDALQEKILEE